MTLTTATQAALVFAALGIVGCDFREKSADVGWERTKDCAAQAAREFEAEGYKHSEKSGDFADFTNHYNPTLRVCFVQIDSTQVGVGTIHNNKQLLDAFERKDYGYYRWNTDPVKKAWEVPPTECYVLSPAGGKKMCTSAEEFDALAAVYMGNQAGATVK